MQVTDAGVAPDPGLPVTQWRSSPSVLCDTDFRTISAAAARGARSGPFLLDPPAGCSISVIAQSTTSTRYAVTALPSPTLVSRFWAFGLVTPMGLLILVAGFACGHPKRIPAGGEMGDAAPGGQMGQGGVTGNGSGGTTSRASGGGSPGAGGTQGRGGAGATDVGSGGAWSGVFCSVDYPCEFTWGVAQLGTRHYTCGSESTYYWRVSRDCAYTCGDVPCSGGSCGYAESGTCPSGTICAWATRRDWPPETIAPCAPVETDGGASDGVAADAPQTDGAAEPASDPSSG